MPATLLDKIWDAHEVDRLDDGQSLLHIDRAVLYELTAPEALAGLQREGRRVRHPRHALAVADHSVSTRPGRSAASLPALRPHLDALARLSRWAGIEHLDVEDPQQGIVHVIAPETGFVLPGMTAVCGDSHTCTLGGVGVLGIGVGSSELEHVLATQTLRVARPAAIRIRCDGTLQRGVGAKDLALFLLGELGVQVGKGRAIEFAGGTVAQLPVEARLTLCNLAAEMGARYGLIGVDAVTIDYARGRPRAPRGRTADAAGAAWRTLVSDPDAHFELDAPFDAGRISPQISWGTRPDMVCAIDAPVPLPRSPAGAAQDPAREALDYMGLRGGQPLLGTKLDVVFIGSCTNARLSDLREAARVVRGRRVAAHVRALVVPGSEAVRRAAQDEGLHEDFLAAGFEWRQAGCSMCVAVNDDVVAPAARCLSTSNRNFAHRQGRDARTHLASPVTAAAGAIAGVIADPREMLP